MTTCSPATPKLDNILLHKYFATWQRVMCNTKDIKFKLNFICWYHWNLQCPSLISNYIKNWTAIRNIFITYKLLIAKTCLLSFKQVLTFMTVDQKPPFRHFRIKSNYEMSWHIKIKVLLNECLTFSLTRKGGVIL